MYLKVHVMLTDTTHIDWYQILRHGPLREKRCEISKTLVVHEFRAVIVIGTRDACSSYSLKKKKKNTTILIAIR